MNTLSTVNRCAQYTLIAGAVGWILSRYVHPIALPTSIGHFQFILALLAVGVVPTVTTVMPAIYAEKTVQRTSIWFGVILATLLMSIATMAHMTFAAVSATACLLVLGLFYLGKFYVLRAIRAHDATP